MRTRDGWLHNMRCSTAAGASDERRGNRRCSHVVGCRMASTRRRLSRMAQGGTRSTVASATVRPSSKRMLFVAVFISLLSSATDPWMVLIHLLCGLKVDGINKNIMGNEVLQIPVLFPCTDVSFSVFTLLDIVFKKEKKMFLRVI